MNKKIKVLLFILLSLALLFGGFFYITWSKNKEVEKALTWVESYDGYIEQTTPEWINKWPENLQGTIKEVVGERLKVKLYITDSSDGKLDLSHLGNLSQLEELTLYHPMEIDLSPLRKCAKLTHLHLANTEIKDLSPLSELPKLEHLTLTNTNISDISALKNVTSLKRLFLEHSQVKDLSPLKDLIKLERLNLTATQISDISALENLTNLEFLYLSSTNIKELNSLKKLNKLELLTIPYSLSGKKEMKELEKALPNLIIKD